MINSGLRNRIPFSGPNGSAAARGCVRASRHSGALRMTGRIARSSRALGERFEPGGAAGRPSRNEGGCAPGELMLDTSPGSRPLVTGGHENVAVVLVRD